MVLLRFTKLIDKVLDHTKKQTIRLRSDHRKKHPLAEGQTLQVYLLFKLGDAKITKLQTKKFIEIDLEDAQQDGCEDFLELSTALVDMHGLKFDDPDLAMIEWDIIGYEPEWPAMKLIEIKQLEEMAKEVQLVLNLLEKLNFQDEEYLEKNIPTLMKLIATKKGDELK